MDSFRLTAKNLSCIRNEKVLFGDLSFELNAGEILHITGANGSGKTSLLRILSSLAPPETGELYWGGQLIHEVRSAYLSNLVYIGHWACVKNELTVIENLANFNALGCQAPLLNSTQALAEVGLSSYQNTFVRQLSAGQKRRVALSCLLLQDRKLWILDEPQTALDKHALTTLEEMLKRHVCGGGMLVVTSHQQIHLPDVIIKQLKIGSP